MSTATAELSQSSPFQRALTRAGMPAPLFLGYVGLLIFMIGDGVESAFIAPFMAEHGAGTEVRASFVVTVYGIAVMLASWLSGALSQLWGPRRVMMLGLAIWVVFDLAFLTLAIGQQSYPLMLITYGIRGFGYPLFAFSFLVWVTSVAPVARLGAAVGWFYFAFTGGMPALGAVVASGVNPVFGHMGSLWFALGLLVVGALISLLGVREPTGSKRLAPPDERPVHSLVSSLSIAWRQPRIGVGMIVRVINTSAEFGMLVFFPTIFADQIGFGEGKWLLLVGAMYGTNVIFNLIFGGIGDRFGWQRTIFWFGAIGCAITIAGLYFLPVWAGADFYWLALLMGVLYGAALAGFVPISALLPSMAPDNRGGAMALLNFGAGAATFVGPAVVSLFLTPLGPGGVVLVFSGMYVIAAVLTRLLKLPKETEQAIASGSGSLEQLSEGEKAPAH